MASSQTLFRQWNLLKTLQSSYFGLTTIDLCERMECSRRTVQRDLRFLQELFPINFVQDETGKKKWKLTKDFIQSEQLQMNLTEVLSLYLGKQLLIPLAGTPFGDGLATALQKIQALLPTKALDYFAQLDDAILIKNFGQDDYAGHSRHIATLNHAILHRGVVKITYPSTTHNKTITTEFHPYGMVLLTATLYCIGYVAAHDEVRTYKVARLKDVRQTSDVFERPATFSLAQHTAGAFGVFGPGKLQRIRAHFTDWAAINVRERQWHPSQTILADDDGTVDAQFELTSTVEFKRWLLGFGRHAVVTSPDWFVKELQEELNGAIYAYGTR